MRKEILRMQEVCTGRYESGGLDKFQFHIKEGEIVGILGNSGAGKTALYEYFMGNTMLKAGTLVFDGHVCPVEARFPYISQVLCIGRNSTLIPGLSVAENIFVINGKRKGWNLVRMSNIKYRARILLGQYAPQLSPDTLARDLTPAQMRLVELLRAIENEVKMVVIDDAFQGFGQSDMKQMYEILMILKKRRVSIIYETVELKQHVHFMDKIVALRKGKHVRTFYEEDYDEVFCRKLLLGNDALPVFEKNPQYTSRQRLRIEGIQLAGKTCQQVLNANEGEVVGLYDKDNRNNTKLLQMIYGERKAEGIRVYLDGQRYIPKDAEHALANRIGYMPKDMDELALVDSMNYMDNLSLPILSSHKYWRPMQNRKISAVLAEEYGEQLGISPEQMWEPVKNFDFYVKNRIFLKRWILFRPKLMVCIEPWEDADLLIRDIMFQAFMEMAGKGTTILISSRNMNGLRSICDSIYVLNDGEETMEKYALYEK